MSIYHIDKLVFIACDVEYSHVEQDVIDGWERKGIKIIHTGVGKVNAAIEVTRALIEYEPDYVINIGTAGKPQPSTIKDEKLFHILYVEQRDMDTMSIMRGLKTPDGDLLFPKWPVKKTPFEDYSFIECQRTLDFNGIAGCLGTWVNPWCSTGDNTNADKECNHYRSALVEMEAYAIVKAIHRHNEERAKYIGGPDDEPIVEIKYDILKFVTDEANSDTISEEWDENKGKIPIEEIIDIVDNNFETWRR
tara:strand:- start:99 stop:845 length:747 start_codon:yes stop_codon:yes gene_type:complete